MSPSVRQKRLVIRTLLQVLATSATSEGSDLLLQVEDFVGPWRKQTNIRGYLGRGFCTSNANPRVASTRMTGKVSIAEAGRYYVWARAYTSPGGRRAFRLQVGDHLLRRTHAENVRLWSWHLAGEVQLPVGDVQIVVHDADRGFESVDAILLTLDKEHNPMTEDQQWLVYGGEIPKKADALRYNIGACCAACKKRTDPPNRQEWDKRRPELRARLAEALGLDPMPAKTPLNPQTTGKAQFEHYTVENIVFESRPEFYVSANLYIPKNVKLPVPGVVVVMGHAMKEGKNYGLYQTAQMGLARQGFVVLGYDPIGQGERLRPGMSHAMGYGSLLVGQTNEGMITWDTIRAVDYLCSRPEVDGSRIGLTGNSGGGENTFYAMPFDERIKAGASFCFVCSYHAWLERGGNHCICNHLPGIVQHLEEFEIVALNAPRAFLFGNGAKDPIFPIDGTRETFRRAKRIYGFYRASSKVKQMDWPLPHGWAQPLREAGYGWLVGWLQDRGDGKSIPEPALRPLPFDAKKLLCFKDGKWPKDAETVVSLNRKRAAELIESYSVLPNSEAEWAATGEKMRSRIWKVLGGKPRAYQPRCETRGAFEWKGRNVTKLTIATESRMEVPALYISPKAVTRGRPVVVYIDEQTKAMARSSKVVEFTLAKGAAVLALDPRATGEIETPANHTASDASVLGRPLLAQRVWDVMQAAKCVATRDDVDAKRIYCYGYGAAGLLALLATALDDTLAGAACDRTIASFAYAIENSQRQPLWVFAPNILKAADVPQVAALCLPKPVVCANPVGYRRQRLAEDKAADAMAFAASIVGAETALSFVCGTDTEAAERIVAHLLRPQ